LSDLAETTVTNLPTTNSDTWTNGQVHVARAYGLTSPMRPDTDGDGLPDGLEVGWRTASDPPTDPAANTDGDAFPNFIGDLDPPFYNTLDNVARVPGVNTASEGGDRAAQRGGSVTNPNNPDTDGDGIKDGIEDTNRNGWVDGDGQSLPTNFLPYLARSWPNDRMDAGEIWMESSPIKSDSDGDGLSDGYGEDKNFNGVIDGDANNNRIYNAGEAWLETDPLNKDSDGDSLSDGWEVDHGLDPLDNGSDNLTTSITADGLADNGAAGNPDGDTIIQEGMTVPYTNALEFANNTDPRSPDTGVLPPAGSIVIGPQAPELVGAVSNAREFTDWTINDLIALDEYDGDGPNNQGGDVYHSGDGFDSSRDIVAFYARDGGDTSLGGDGQFYFRVDLRDLAALAEDGKLDLYVVVDTGSPTAGEYALPDDVDVATDMKWEAVVACYSGNNGTVYVDTQNGNNSISIGQALGPFGVVARDPNATDGFRKAYFNSELDSVEFSISRKALRDAGWSGLNAAQLNYQVFTTKDGTANNPVGAGDIGGRNDIRDTIKDDFLASDYFADQSYISQPQNAVLRGYVGKNSDNDRGKRAKVVSLIHGNQALQPGSTTQALINNAAGAGYYRPLDIHQAYNAPVAMHVTPTLASSIQWAKVDPLSPRQYRDGPALNARLRQLAQGGVIDLLGSTFADHVIGYFPQDFNSANVLLANDFLTNFYAGSHSSSVFWNPERVADANTLSQIQSLGFSYTFIDQMRHVQKWFGRNSSLGDDGYRINEVNGVKCFVINDQASTYRFQNTDKGVALSLRDLLHRKARSGTQDQVIVLFSQWEEFTNKTNADAYDQNIRWIASRPWLQLVTPDQIAGGEVDLSQPPDGIGDTWGSVNRGTSGGLVKVAHDYVDHATQENYDNWYNGLGGREEGLRDKRFDIRPGVQLAAGKEFGTLGLATGIVSEAWAQVAALPVGNLATLARGAAGAAVFQTAFHNQTSNNLSKYSTGAYIYPDTTNQTLAGFAKVAHAQFRSIAVFNRVQAWSVAAVGGTYNGTTWTEAADVDLDGEAEYLLSNDRIFAVFERIGGRMTGAWVRDPATNAIHQAVGNPLGYAGSEDETEGTSNITGGAVGAYRTSGFKDWFANGASNALAYVNDLYTATPAASGWTFTSSDGNVAKSITLAAGASSLSASYTLGSGVGPLYVRFGMSPNLNDLLRSGQANLTPLVDNSATGEAGVTNYKSTGMVRTFVRYGGANSASFSPTAVDRDSGVIDTVNMRNQAQTQQLEIFGNNGMTFELGLAAGPQDTDQDGLPTDWESLNNLDDNDLTGDNGANGDPDRDGISNIVEWLVGLNPQGIDNSAYPRLAMSKITGGFRFAFPTLPGRKYQVQVSSVLTGWEAFGAPLVTPSASPPGIFQIDDTAALPKRFYRMVVTPAP
jgi:Glycosyl hydrolase family 57